MASIKKMITEEGIVLSKIYREATESFMSRDGKEVAAQPERFIILCASGEKVDPDTGVDNAVIQEYKVSREEFQNFKFLQKVICKYEFSSYGCKPVSVTLKK